MLWEAFVLLVGLFVIYVGGRLLISGASSAATELGLTPLVVGATIVAFGTSAPELFLAFFSALDGEAQVSIGNVIGANINNLTLVLGRVRRHPSHRMRFRHGEEGGLCRPARHRPDGHLRL